MKSNLFIIAQNGWRAIGLSFVIFVFLYLFDFDFLATLAFLFTLFLLFIYRNPERQIATHDDKSILAPIDGTVKKIESLKDNEYAYMIEVESSYAEVGVLRAPVDAKIMKINLTKGSRLAKFSPLFEKLNESAEVIFQKSDGNKIRIVHRLKRSIVPLDINFYEGEEIAAAARYAYMIDGVAYIYLESDVRINVTVGQKIEAAQTLLAYSS